MTPIFANNAATTLSGTLNSSATTLSVATGTGALFASPAAGQFFALDLNDAATGLLNEIVYVTGVAGDTMTVIRGQEGTSARAWAIGDSASNNLTAGVLNALPELGKANTWTAANIFSGTVTVPNAATATEAVALGQFVVGSGSLTLPGGFIIKWGTTNSVTGYLDVINFPVAFPNNCFSVVGLEGEVGGWTATPTPTLYGVGQNNAASFYLSVVSLAHATGIPSYAAGKTFQYIAIGN